MTRVRALAGTAFVLALATLPLLMAGTGSQPLSDHAKQIGSHLKCMCGSCDMTASICSHPGGTFSGPCQAWAQPALREIDSLLAQGKTEQQIIDSFVAQYGPMVYAVPPKSGFSLVAWAMPTVYLVLGALLVIFVISRWRKRPATEPGPEVSAASHVPAELLERARARVAQDTED